VQQIANRTTPQGWEMFTVVDAGGGLIALRSSNGLYVSADTNIAAYAPLVANRPTFSTWEKFTWTDVGTGQVTLRASTNGKYVSADLNRSANLVADRTTAQGWETFTWGTGSTPQPTTPPTAIPGWNLVWSDEFNGPSVNTSNWSFQTGCSGWGNAEWEDYTNGANTSFENGVLVIEARMKPGAALGACGMTSTRMNTSGKRSFQYGKMEARIAIPMGQGTWPAFWMMGNVGTWPSNGEIDIMEHINSTSDNVGTLHWNNNGHQSSGASVNVSNMTSYHVYGIEWDASQIKFYVDGNYYNTINISSVPQPAFHQPSYFLLNLAIGGAWPGYPTSTSIMPARYYIDYVRVYQH
jgi:beta-glucanase (GH16 family)